MATKPTVRIPVWNSGGTGSTDPGASKESAGWQAAELIPAEWLNWLQNAYGQWLEWAEEAIDEIYDIPDDGDLATLFYTSTRDLGGVHNTYLTDAAIVFAYDCEWSEGTGWVSAGNGNSGIITVRPQGSLPQISLEYGTLSGGTFPHRLELREETMSSASGTVSTTAGSTTGAVTAGSSGIASVTSSDDDTGIISVTLSKAMGSTDYHPTVTARGTQFVHYIPAVTSQTLITIRAYSHDGSLIDLSGFSAKFTLDVKGKR